MTNFSEYTDLELTMAWNHLETCKLTQEIEHEAPRIAICANDPGNGNAGKAVQQGCCRSGLAVGTGCGSLRPSHGIDILKVVQLLPGGGGCAAQAVVRADRC